MVSKSMMESMFKKQLSFVPEAQPFYTFANGGWHASTHTPIAGEASPLRSLQLVTWNIDFMAPYPRARMQYALSYLEKVVSQIPASRGVIVFLQEMMEDLKPSQDPAQESNDLSQLRDAAWVQQRFHMTDVNQVLWKSDYGQVTLIDRRLAVARVSRLPLISEYRRTALIVDIPTAISKSCQLRLCNVHLDSMGGSLRPVQWQGIAKHLQNDDEGVLASIMAGDCNANQPRDKTEPQDNGFKDAFLELGGTEDDEEGFTWGFQSPDGNRWGHTRLDKVVYWGDIEAKSLVRIGVGVKVEDESAVQGLAAEDLGPYVTDHYGLMSEFFLDEGLLTLKAGEEI